MEQAANAGLNSRLGVATAMTVDQHGHPMLAVLSVDPNGDGTGEDNVVFFTRWNGASKAWTVPKQIAVVGDIDIKEPGRPLSIARDADTGTIGIAFVDSGDKLIRLATSLDEGTTWSLDSGSGSNTADVLSNPVLTMRAGTVHLAYHHLRLGCSVPYCGSVSYRKRSAGGAFTAPSSPSGSARWGPLAMALDSAGEPGLAYFQGELPSATVQLMYWSPGGSPTLIADSQGVASDPTIAEQRPSVSLTYVGRVAHLAFHLRTADPVGQLWYVKEAASWAPVAIPRNGTANALEETRWYQALAVDDTGRIAIAAQFARTTGQPQMCGGPKLARASATAGFLTCAPDSARTFGYAGASVNLAWRAPGKLVMAFPYENRANPALNNKAGVVLWWEP
jgi:hypothetical protein